MCGEMFATSFRNGLVALFVRIINELPEGERRAEVILWLHQAAEVMAAPLGLAEKARRLDHLPGAGRIFGKVFDLLRQSMAEYRNLAFPGPLKMALPATLMSLPLVGAQGLGLAALGGVLTGPTLLLVFLGTAGISAILDSLPPQSREKKVPQSPTILRTPRGVVRAKVEPSACQDLPQDEKLLRKALQEMNPFAFERHIMGFFSRSGMDAWVTAKTNDIGVDGFARHPRGLIVVQCKRNAASNLVGRPVIQQMKGVVAEHNALRGYLVTTARFSDHARDSAKMSDQLVLVDMPELVRWHLEPPRLCA